MLNKQSDDQKAQLDMSGIKQQRGDKDLKSNVTMNREEDATLFSQHGQNKCSFMFRVGEARPRLKTLSHATAQHKSERRGGKKFPVVMETSSALVTLPSLWQALSFTTTGEMKNSQFSFSTSQPLYMNPALHPLYLSSISPSFICCSHLRKTNLRVYLLFSQKKPQH